jgi:hypothetical protein
MPLKEINSLCNNEEAVIESFENRSRDRAFVVFENMWLGLKLPSVPIRNS